MSFLQELKDEYKITAEAYREAKEKDDKKLMLRFSEDLVRIADAMEREK